MPKIKPGARKPPSYAPTDSSPSAKPAKVAFVKHLADGSFSTNSNTPKRIFQEIAEKRDRKKYMPPPLPVVYGDEKLVAQLTPKKTSVKVTTATPSRAPLTLTGEIKVTPTGGEAETMSIFTNVPDVQPDALTTILDRPVDGLLTTDAPTKEASFNPRKHPKQTPRIPSQNQAMRISAKDYCAQIGLSIAAASQEAIHWAHGQSHSDGGEQIPENLSATSGRFNQEEMGQNGVEGGLAALVKLGYSLGVKIIAYLIPTSQDPSKFFHAPQEVKYLLEIKNPYASLFHMEITLRKPFILDKYTARLVGNVIKHYMLNITGDGAKPKTPDGVPPSAKKQQILHRELLEETLALPLAEPITCS